MENFIHPDYIFPHIYFIHQLHTTASKAILLITKAIPQNTKNASQFFKKHNNT